MTDWTDKKRGYSGDRGNLGSHINPMSFNRKTRELLGNLDQTLLKRTTPDGNISVKGFGMYEKVRLSPKKIDRLESNLVCVYVGSPASPFSEYGVADLVERSRFYWNTTPEQTLAKLGEKKLLILPCPVRELTEKEIEIIQKFLKGNRRIAFFSGSNITLANTVLTQIGSKLTIFEYDYTDVPHLLSGKIGANELVLWAGQAVGRVSVHKDYWSTALLRDWRGFGILYNDVTCLSPFNIVAWRDPWSSPEQEAMIGDWIGDYEHSNDLIAKVNAYNPPPEGTDPVWTVTDSASTTWFPSGYLDGLGYGSMNLTSWGAWMSANSANMPMYYIHDNGYVRTRAQFLTSYYFTFTDAKYRGYTDAFLAYSGSIIVGAFKPSWLLTDYDSYIAQSGQSGTKALSNWLLSSELVYSDFFNQGGFLAMAGAHPYWNRGGYGSGWFDQPIQF